MKDGITFVAPLDDPATISGLVCGTCELFELGLDPNIAG
jgi:hypothetical protein